MFKHLRKLSMSLLAAMAFMPAVAGTTPLEFYEDFDTTDAMGMPEGWKADGSMPFAVYPASWTSMSAESGDNILFTPGSTSVRNEVVYTPMLKLAAGKECKVTFSFMAPGGTPPSMRNNGLHVKAGTAQEADAQTIEVGEVTKQAYATWTEFSFTFTPETDGEYCVSFWLHQGESTMTQTGNVGIENVEILGWSPAEGGGDEPEVPEDPIVLEPDPENEADAEELPYFENFDNDNGNYDGTSWVPNKWLTTGTAPLVTANFDVLKAQSGDWYLLTSPSTEVRDERLYTPFFVLTAGTEYTVSYYLYHPGQIWDDAINTTSVEFTVGTQQEKDFHKSLVKHEGYNAAWELCEVKFTPEVSGAYCFSFALSSEAAYAGVVCIDTFKVTAPGLTPSPKAKFAVNHNYNLMTSNIAAFTGQAVQLSNLSEYGESYQWSVDSEDAVISDATAENPTITFSASGEYKVTLSVTNSRSTRSTSKSLAVDYFDSNEQDVSATLATNAPDDQIYQRGMVPTFNESETDFISGPNCYYRKYAERFNLPAGVKLNLSQIVGWYTNLHYKYINNSRDDQLNTPFSVVFYGETDGKLDEEKVFGRYTSTMVDVFGSTGVGAGYGETFSISFDEPIELEGPCYVAFEVDDNFDMIITDTQVGASYMGMLAIKHASEATTIYAKPYAVPETSRLKVDEWGRIDLIDPTMKGFGIMINLWTKYNETSGSVAIAADGTIVFDVRVEGDNILVSGTRQGEEVCLYNVNGMLVAKVAGGEGSTVIDATSLPAGFYVVKAEAGSKKFVK